MVSSWGVLRGGWQLVSEPVACMLCAVVMVARYNSNPHSGMGSTGTRSASMT